MTAAQVITPGTEEAHAALDKLAANPEFTAAYWSTRHERHDWAVSVWTALWRQAYPLGGAESDPPCTHLKQGYSPA